MLQRFCIVFVVSTVFIAFGISQEPSQRERAERRAQQAQRQQEAIFGGKMPPGVATVVGRSVFRSNYPNLANSATLLEASRNPNIQKELGLTDDQVSQMQSARSDLNFQMLGLAPKYVTRFKAMTNADHDAVQEELQKEFDAINQRINARLDAIVTPEQKNKARTLVFQSTGGIDSPLVNMDALATLNLTDAQKEKAKATLSNFDTERFAQLEEGLQLVEKAIAKGGVNMSAEDRKAIEEEGQVLQSKILTTGKKYGDELRTFLTQEQLDLEKRLMAERPGFLPPLPRARWGMMMGEYVPGLDSWMPGQGAPKDQTQERKLRPFPKKEQADE